MRTIVLSKITTGWCSMRSVLVVYDSFRCETAEREVKTLQEDHKRELKSLQSKLEATEQFMKQESALSSVKVHKLLGH